MTHGNYQKYTNPNPIQQWLIRRFLHRVADLVARSGARSILDVGCAEGFVSRHVREHAPRVTAFGVDLDVVALARGRQMSVPFPTSVGNALNLPLATESVDLVLCTEVLEHIPQPQRALSELLRVSRGYLLLSVPWEPWFRVANLLRLKNVPRWGDDPEHVNHWTGRGFRNFLSPFVTVVEHRVAFPWQIVLARK